MYHGISTLQPVHHVAQKSSSTTRPLYLDNVTGAPLASVSAKSGASVRSFPERSGVETLWESVEVAAPARVRNRATAAAAPIRVKNVRIMRRAPPASGGSF